jgi:hypothetical protein
LRVLDSHAAWDTGVREKRQKQWRVLVNPLRQAGPRLTNTLQAPSRNPSIGMDWLEIPPQVAWPPKAASHILNTAATARPRTADEQYASH